MPGERLVVQPWLRMSGSFGAYGKSSRISKQSSLLSKRTHASCKRRRACGASICAGGREGDGQALLGGESLPHRSTRASACRRGCSISFGRSCGHRLADRSRAEDPRCQTCPPSGPSRLRQRSESCTPSPRAAGSLEDPKAPE
eukprot:2816484-Prymnesium_polylepis.1